MIPGATPGVPGGVNGRPAGWRPYKYRDPARLSRERLAELAAHDEHIAALHAAGDSSDPPDKVHGASIIKATAAKMTAYYTARDNGYSQSLAAALAGASTRSAGRWEAERPTLRQFDVLRRAGVLLQEATVAVGVTMTAGRRFEAVRRLAQTSPTSQEAAAQ